MAKKQPKRQEERSTADYYHLNTKAVDDLVTANEENSPPVDQRELRRYHAGTKKQLPAWLKAVLLKAWFAGIVCYFFIWGLSTYVMNQWDSLAIVGVALGFVTDLVTNNVLRFIAKPEGANDRWMLFPRKGFISLPLNLVYAFVLLACVVMTYNLINTVASGFTGSAEAILGVEPIGFGLLAMAWDMLFIGMKRMLGRIVQDAKRQAGR